MQSIEIAANDRVFVLTGAGISAESGLATFRDSDGLWSGYRIEDVCTPEAWDNNPELVWQFYSARRENAEKAQPNPAHRVLAELEDKLDAKSGQVGDRFFLCTQNVDELHERAGTRNLVHMHGELFMSRCSEGCGKPPIADHARYDSKAEISRCSCRAMMRPHIVWFGEMPFEMDRISREINRATVMLVIGTSGSVYPAAAFVRWARQAGARTIYIGPEEPLNAKEFTRIVLGKAGEVLSGLFVID
ncbi:NAD-dependent deacylase [Acidicapsa dinghuensis]|uniref:NAD-dependent protein deacylase n=1 Tax=Acidicapsa dinghuensis TaxID=2218256 RepID=A0ABW1EGG9_9BACT|nr:NAD-dependent deacylase [Acidicapsa dinghuensis]